MILHYQFRIKFILKSFK